MMTKKNLAKAVTLSLLLSTALSANAWALEINNETINSSSIAADNRFVEANFGYNKLYSFANGDKIILDNVDLTFDKNFQGFVGISKINDMNINGAGIIIANSSNENADNNIIDIDNVNLTDELSSVVVVYGGYADIDSDSVSNNVVNLIDSEVAVIYGGGVIDSEGITEPVSVKTKVHNNTVVLDGATIRTVYGGYMGETKNNGIIVKNKTTVNGNLFAGYGSVEEDNYINIIGENYLSNASISGYLMGQNHKGNTLNLDGFNGDIKQISNFDKINFKNLDLNKTETITTDWGQGLTNTEIQISSFANGQDIEVGKTVDLMKIEDKDSWNESFTNLNKQTTTDVGLSRIVTSDIGRDEATQTLTATVAKIERNQQTDLVASNRAVAAAFVNQGTDLIADSLDTLSRDGKYGVKTFAAVHGNRSKYDVNSDIKINGWSTIVGVGAETEHNGGDFSWGVFYENGSGNYRTYNDFNNEFFRGDGSLVYNGGGIAARYENSHGVYTEGSLRAGMLKSEMTDALSDGENKYGYESETAYYGAHIGVGKIFSLGDDSDLDVYGKFFHTYTEGDSFNVADDEFEFDSINSDRLRIGARVTSNKENKFSTYYGLAYEYEFNGDAEMRAAGMKAPTQSLQGSSVMAEIGLNYQPTPDSPWSFDLNMRGYAGERQGGSFNVQATYTF